MSVNGHKSDDPLEISSTDTKNRSLGVLYYNREGLIKVERNPPARGFEKASTGATLCSVWFSSNTLQYKKLTEAEFQDINDCESEDSGTFFHSTEEVAFDNQEHFSEQPKLIVALLDYCLKTHIKRCEVAKPKDHYGEEVHCLQM
jgi:hypothetical protein